MILIFKDKHNYIKGTIKALRYGLVTCCFCCVVWGVTAWGAQSPPTLSPAQMVEQAVAFYEAGDRTTAKAFFAQAAAITPQHHAIAYYLGLIYFEEGNRSAAIAKWQQFVAMDPQSQNAMKIRKYLTLLKREQAREDAKKALIQEASPKDQSQDQNTVAVTTFDNVGYIILGPLGKGLAAMLISDLSLVPDVTVVDRHQVQALLDEMALGKGGLVDADSAPRVKKLVKADHMVYGSLNEMKGEDMQVSFTVFDKEGKKTSGIQQVKGSLTQLYGLEKEIACTIVKEFGKECDNLPSDFQKVHTDSISALVAFSWGLDHFDHERYDKAREMFQKALEKDPNFELAEKALLDTPSSAIAGMSAAQMISNISASGKSVVAAGNSKVEDRGISKTALIGGGLALAAGGVALAGSGGGSNSVVDPVVDDTGGDTGGDTSSTKKPEYEKWTGSIIMTADNGGKSIYYDMNIEKSDTSVKGKIEFSQWDCVSTADVTGTITSVFAMQTCDLAIRSGSVSINVNGLCSNKEIVANVKAIEPNTEKCAEAEDAGFFGRKK